MEHLYSTKKIKKMNDTTGYSCRWCDTTCTSACSQSSCSDRAH
nr:hypothetical protein [uncultured Lachnoclostridium sp.]